MDQGLLKMKEISINKLSIKLILEKKLKILV